MILSDNETKLDLLNNMAIAKTIVSIILDSKESISIGVHGDWGAGKSSILAMVEEEVKANIMTSKEGKTPIKAASIRFNGWQHQGFEDSKIALMSAIVSQLVNLAETHPVKEGAKNIKEIAKKLWKNINWLSVAKKIGSIGFSLATGTAPLTILTSAYETLKGAVDSKEKVETTIGSIGEFIQSASVSEDTSSLKEFEEFRKNFIDLLDAAGIDKLIVIIDDLDRCLPTVAIETLESIRLFMFMEKTAFVIGADEVMIRYAVKKHFPDMERETGVNTSNSFADKYLEKLIQIPFKIPALGQIEAHLYIMLLMVGSKLEAESAEYKKLITDVLGKLAIPWDIKPYSIDELKVILGEQAYNHAQDEVLIALQISPILYEYSRGNPRVIKRFINMLLLRNEVAKNRGYGASIKLPLLAKLMLAERSWPKLHENIAYNLTNEGLSEEIEFFEERYKSGEEIESTQEIEWLMAPEYKRWILSEPSLSGVDLRPYYVASKERKELLIGYDPDEKLREIVYILMMDEFGLASHRDEIQSLTEENASKAFDIVSSNVISGDLSQKPPGFSGLKVLTELHPALRAQLVGFISALPCDKVDVWIISGWEQCLPEGSAERANLQKYLQKLSLEGNELVRKMLKKNKE